MYHTKTVAGRNAARIAGDVPSSSETGDQISAPQPTLSVEAVLTYGKEDCPESLCKLRRQKELASGFKSSEAVKL